MLVFRCDRYVMFILSASLLFSSVVYANRHVPDRDRCFRVKVTAYAPGKICRWGGIQGKDKTKYLNKRTKPSEMAADKDVIVSAAIPRPAKNFLGHFARFQDVPELADKTIALIDTYGRKSNSYGDASGFRKIDIAHSSCQAVYDAAYNQREATICIISSRYERDAMADIINGERTSNIASLEQQDKPKEVLPPPTPIRPSIFDFALALKSKNQPMHSLPSSSSSSVEKKGGTRSVKKSKRSHKRYSSKAKKRKSKKYLRSKKKKRTARYGKVQKSRYKKVGSSSSKYTKKNYKYR